MKSIKIEKDLLKEIKNAITPSVITFLVWLLFQKPLAELWLKFISIVELWPDKDYGYLGAVIFSISLIVAISYVIYAKSKGIRYGRKQVLLYATLMIIYFAYRLFLSAGWVYVPINHLNPLCYSDILALIPISLISIEFWVKKNKTASDSKPVQKFLTDIPFKIEKNDTSGRYDAAIKLKDLIIKTDSSDHSFAVGINGNWGSGKTSFLMAIERNLPTNVIKFSFNPWNKTSNVELIELFLDELKKNVSLFDKSLNNLLNDYSNAIVKNVESPLLKTVKDISEIFGSNSTTIESKKSSINRVIKKHGKKIVVFIDDIDRLDKKEVFEVLRLIRNAADFSNVFFICAFDRRYVISAIKDITDYNSEFFLEKIFQVDLALPELTRTYLIELLTTNLSNNCFSTYSNEEFTKMKKDYQFSQLINNCERHIKTARDNIKFINQYIFWGKLIEEEVFFPHLYAFHFLRSKYPEVIDLLQYQHKEVLEYPKNTYEMKGFLTLKMSSDQSDYRIEQLLIDNKFSENVIKEIIETLEMLFPKNYGVSNLNNRYSNQQYGINTVDGFPRYFVEVDVMGSVSTSRLNSARATSHFALIEEIKKSLNKHNNNYEILNYLINTKSYKNVVDYQNIIEAFVFFADQSNKSTDMHYILEFVNKLDLRYEREEEKILFPEDKEKRGYIFSLLEKTNGINDFLENVIFYIIEGNLCEDNDKKELLTILKSKLETALEKTPHLDDATFALYRRLFSVVPLDPKIKQSINEEITISLKQCIETHSIVWFINYCATWRNYDKNLKFGIDNWCKVIYGSVEIFIEKLEKYDIPEAHEFIEFYNVVLQESNFQNKPLLEILIPYNFKNIKSYGLR